MSLEEIEINSNLEYIQTRVLGGRGGFVLLTCGCEWLNTVSGTLDIGSEMLDAKSRMLDTESGWTL